MANYRVVSLQRLDRLAETMRSSSALLVLLRVITVLFASGANAEAGAYAHVPSLALRLLADLLKGVALASLHCGVSHAGANSSLSSSL